MYSIAQTMHLPRVGRSSRSLCAQPSTKVEHFLPKNFVRSSIFDSARNYPTDRMNDAHKSSTLHRHQPLLRPSAQGGYCNKSSSRQSARENTTDKKIRTWNERDRQRVSRKVQQKKVLHHHYYYPSPHHHQQHHHRITLAYPIWQARQSTYTYLLYAMYTYSIYLIQSPREDTDIHTKLTLPLEHCRGHGGRGVLKNEPINSFSRSVIIPKLSFRKIVKY